MSSSTSQKNKEASQKEKETPQINKAGFLLSVHCKTLVKKEIHRFWAVAGQTITAPLISAALYFFIFGVSLGSRISMHPTIPYLAFIIPGLIIMAVLNNSYQNTSSSIVNAKYHGNIKDILCAPLDYGEIVIAYVIAAVVRGMMVGFLVFLVSCLFLVPKTLNPFPAIAISALGAVTFALLGMIAGICSEGWEELSVWSRFVLLPLTYLGGVFYSIDILPEFWKNISKLNPLLYIVDLFRYSFLGISDINPVTDIIVVLVMTAILFGIVVKLLRSGYGLRN